jgi:hypothetical protein
LKYTIIEFAKQIRNLYPSDYNDLSDETLTKLWLKKFPNDIDKVDLNIKESLISTDYFSFKGMIASVFFGYLAYCIYPIAILGNSAYYYLNDDKIMQQILLIIFNNMTEGKFSEYASFFHFWFWLLFLSFVFKAIISLRHTFISPKNNFRIVGAAGILFDLMPIFLFVWSQNNIKNALPLTLFFIPTFLGMLFLFTKDVNTNN